jgi:SAM-dependent methyltransferase
VTKEAFVGHDMQAAGPGPDGTQVDTTMPQSARIYDYWLGGKDNFAPDRAVAEALAGQIPTIRTMVRSQRVFLVRAVDYLVREAGIRQFLDIGTGIPSQDNVHEVAQRIAPECRVLYVDNDPIVLAHARALMTSTEDGRTAFIFADLRRPQAILDDPVLRGTLDLSRPVALLLVGVLHHLHDSDDPGGIVRTLLDALPSGSHFVLTQPTADFDPPAMAAMAATAERSGIPYVPRGRTDVEALLDGLSVVEPGLVPIPAWNPLGLDYPGSAEVDRDPYSVYGWAAVARKP